MTVPRSAASLVTPLEPAHPGGAAADAARAPQHAVHTTALRHIEAAAVSQRGNRHATNEDAHSALSRPGNLFVVADGVGGGAMARLASQQLVLRLHAALDGRTIDAGTLRGAMRDADREIAQRIARVTESPGAATVALCAPANATASKWFVAWVGDCRVYRLARHGASRLALLTQDDTFAHLDETPPPGSTRDDPARMVGNGAVGDANVALHTLACGEMLMLCSDGVHRYLEADQIRELLERPLSLAERCEALIARARSQGSTDDATVLLLRRSGRWPGWVRAIGRWLGVGRSPAA